jgi:hypothetical protein
MVEALTVIRKKPWEVDARLSSLALTRPGLLKVRTIALGAGADATPFHPINAPGTLAYQHGTFALRDEFVGKGWVMARPEGVEAIFNAKANAMVAFANVDVACSDSIDPKPRSRKGAGAERLAQYNLFGSSLPQYAPRAAGGRLMLYLMVAENGAAELTAAGVKNGTFTAFLERNYLSAGTDLDGDKKYLDTDGPMDNFDPQVVRKRG